MTFTSHTACSCRSHPQAVPGLEFRTFPVTSPALTPTRRCRPPTHTHTLSLPHQDLLTLDKKNPQTCTSLHCRQNGLLAFRRGTQTVKGKKTWPASPPRSLLSLLSLLPEQTFMFTFFLSRQLCLSRLTCSFVSTNPSSHARSIFFFSFSTFEYFLLVVPVVTLPPSPSPSPPFLSLSASVSADRPTTPYWQIHEIDHFYTGGWIY